MMGFHSAEGGTPFGCLSSKGPQGKLLVPYDFIAKKNPPFSRWASSCRRRDSNPHTLRHTPLKRACLPISPLRHNPSSLRKFPPSGGGSARDWTRTSTACAIRPSNVRVYQFHHPGRSLARRQRYKSFAIPPRLRQAQPDSLRQAQPDSLPLGQPDTLACAEFG